MISLKGGTPGSIFFRGSPYSRSYRLTYNDQIWQGNTRGEGPICTGSATPHPKGRDSQRLRNVWDLYLPPDRLDRPSSYGNLWGGAFHRGQARPLCQGSGTPAAAIFEDPHIHDDTHQSHFARRSNWMTEKIQGRSRLRPWLKFLAIQMLMCVRSVCGS